MTGKDALKNALTSTQNMLGMFVADLSDADLLVRPVPNANHIAWQLGHLIGSEHFFLNTLGAAAACPKLPDGWADQHGKRPPAKIRPRVYQASTWSCSTYVNPPSVASNMTDDLDRDDGDVATRRIWGRVHAHGQPRNDARRPVHVRHKLGKPVLSKTGLCWKPGTRSTATMASRMLQGSCT